MAFKAKIALVFVLFFVAAANSAPTYSENNKKAMTPAKSKLTMRAATSEEIAKYFAKADSNFADQNYIGENDGLPGLGDILDFGKVEKWIVLIKELLDVAKPRATIKTAQVSVLPSVSPTWQQMHDWQGPQAVIISMDLANKWGSTVVRHDYAVKFNYGGKYQNRGNFIANATIVPTETQVSMFWTYNAEVTITQPLNHGSELEPIAGLEMDLHWKATSPLASREATEMFYIRGSGEIQHITK
jgi:hypothetical protein